MGVVGLIRSRRVAPLGSLGSSAVAEFIGVRPSVLQVHQGSLGSLGCALVVIGFILCCWVHWGAY